MKKHRRGTTTPTTPWWLYILECEDGSLYTGIAKDPHRRFTEHSRGRGAAYTRLHKPLRILYLEAHPSRRDAMRRELEIKRLPRAKKLLLATPQDHTTA